MALIVLEFLCPNHGRFESLEVSERAPDELPCPRCNAMSPWAISAPAIKPQYAAAASTGKSDPPPSPYYLDTEPLADGMPIEEFKAKRDKVWERWREDQIKKAVS